MNIIDLKDICFAYDDTAAISHLSMQIQEKESVILKGPNGCGKSTLLQILNGLLFPQRGEYLFMGDAVNKKSMADQKFAKQLHQKIGYLFQNAEIQLFSNNVEDEIAFGILQMQKEEAEVKSRVEDMLRLLNIEKLRYRAPYHLSGGEKKKVALASILVVNPQILILDEPLSGLDQKSQEWMTDFLLQMKSAGKTLLIATHNETFAKKIGDREFLMEEIQQEKA